MSGDRARSTSKNAAFLLLGTFVRMIGNFLFVLYSADCLGLTGFGRLNIANHLFELFVSLNAAAAAIMLTRDVSRWQRNLDRLVSAAMLLAIGLSCIVPLVMVGIGFLFGYSAETMEALMIASVAILPSALCVLFEAVFVARHQSRYVAMGSSIESILRVTLGIWVLHLGFGISMLMWILVIVRSGLLLFYWLSLVRITQFRFHYSRASFRRYVWRWRMFAAENWMATIYTSLDLLMVSAGAGEVAAGLYSAALKIVRLAGVFPKSFTAAVFPVMSRLHSESQARFHQLFKNSTRILCIVALPITIGGAVIAHRIIAIMYKPEYAQAAPLLQVLIVALFFEFLNPFLSHVLFAQHKQHRSMHAAAISLTFNLLTSYVFVCWFGPVGAALAYIGSGLLAMSYYLSSIASKRDMIELLTELVRILLAAAGMGLAVYFVREQSFLLVFMIASATYFPLLFLLQGARIEDVRFFQHTFLKRAAS
jgi:O-antigen/teichoic acid export membrane protein